MIDPEAIGLIAGTLAPTDFYHPKNRDIFASMLHLCERGEPTDYVMMGAELSRINRIEHVGGDEYLRYLVLGVPTSIHVEHYAGVVKRCALNRRAITASGQIAKIAFENPETEELAAGIRGIVDPLLAGASSTAGGAVRLSDVLRDYLETIQLGMTDEAAASARIPSGFLDLDRTLGGFARGDLIILAARPSIGKTALALNIARNAAVMFGSTVHLFSVEMSRLQIAQRFLSAESGVDSARLREGRLSEPEIRKVGEALDALSVPNVWIDDMAQIPLAELCARARQTYAAEGTDLIIVDYLQLVTAAERGHNKVQEVSDISAGLKGLARELNVPILVLSQLSRAVENRSPHIPMLSDLRDSGSIEQDADVVMFITRDDVYDKESERKGIADILIAKHRNGPTGQVSLFFRHENTRFYDFSRSEGFGG